MLIFTLVISCLTTSNMPCPPGTSLVAQRLSICLQCGIPGFKSWARKIPWRRNGNPFQYSCLENPMDGGACWATVHGVAKSWTRLSNFTHSLNMPWLKDITFQVPRQYCSLQHRNLLLSPVASTSGCCFWFCFISSLFLELFLHWSPVAYWVPTDLGSSSSSALSFCLFIVSMGFSRQEYWSGLLCPSPVDHLLSELSTMTNPSWVALHGMAHNLIELGKAVLHVIIG